MRAEQVNALPAGNFGVQVLFFSHLPYHYQFIRRNLATGNTWNNRLGAAFLNISQITVITILYG